MLKVEPSNALEAKLATYLLGQPPLTASEIELLLKLQSHVRDVRRGEDIVVQGRGYDGIFILMSGFALRYKVMSDGKRQVFNVSVPGDVVGYPACFFSRALYSVTATARATICTVTFSELVKTFNETPRLGAALLWLTASETAIFGEHLVNIGRRNAYERVAHFILEMSTRLKIIGMSNGLVFSMPLTQEKIADVVGLSVPHVNRMLRRLREEKLIETQSSRITIVDNETLAAIADFDDSYLVRHRALDGIFNAALGGDSLSRRARAFASNLTL